MHSIGERSFMIISYGIYMIAFTLAGLTLSTSTFPKKVDNAKIEGDAEWLRRQVDQCLWSSKVDTAQINFNVSADFGALFNWNVKQVFLYVMVEYYTDNLLNQAIIWDGYVTRGEEPKLNLHNVVSKYLVSDSLNGLRNKEAKIILRWNVIRNVGGLLEGSTFGSTFQFPREYGYGV